MGRHLKTHLYRTYGNVPEQECKDKMTKYGYKVIKRGYPDFIGFKGNNFICVEVKPRDDVRLSSYQIKVMDLLSQKGIKCYKYSCDKGFELWTKEKSYEEKAKKGRRSKKELKLLEDEFLPNKR